MINLEDVYILILIFILILVNGFFAAAEMALVSLNQNRVNQLADEGNKKAKALRRISNDSTKYLSTIQVAITLAGFLSSAIAGSNLAENFTSFFQEIGITLPFNLSVVIITLILSFFTLIFGELVPKKIALNSPEKIALFSVGILKVTMFITRPAVWLLAVTTKGIVNLFGLNKSEDKNLTSENEIKQMIRSGHMQGLFKKKEKDMLENIFAFDDIEAERIMTPRIDIYAIDINDSKDEIIDQIIKAPYTRIPFFDKNIDTILGTINTKDVLIEAKKKGFSRINYRKLIREPYYVPSNIKINDLFTRMQKTNQQIALILDGFGGIEGIVTLEDIIEEIVGNIYDEFDEYDKSIEIIDDNTYVVDGLIQIQDLNRYFKININEEAETLSGVIIERLGYIPQNKVDKEFSIEGLIIKVQSIKNNHIDKVIIKKETS